MKWLSLIFLLFLSFQPEGDCYSVFEIKYRYTDKRVDKLLLTLADNKAFNKEALLKKRDKDFVLLTNDTCSLFQGPDIAYYRNLKLQEFLYTTTWHDRNTGENLRLIIRKDVPEAEWTIVSGSKETNGYKVYKALYRDGKTRAWFTPDIPLDAGPEFYSGLPGLIVKLVKPNGIEYSLVSITKKRLPIKQPEGDRSMTEAEYKRFLQSNGVFGLH